MVKFWKRVKKNPIIPTARMLALLNFVAVICSLIPGWSSGFVRLYTTMVLLPGWSQLYLGWHFYTELLLPILLMAALVRPWNRVCNFFLRAAFTLAMGHYLLLTFWVMSRCFLFQPKYIQNGTDYLLFFTYSCITVALFYIIKELSRDKKKAEWALVAVGIVVLCCISRYLPPLEHDLRVWCMNHNPNSAIKLYCFKSRIDDLAITPDGNYFLVIRTHSSTDESVVMYDSATGNVYRKIPAQGSYSAAFSPNGRYLALGLRKAFQQGHARILKDIVEVWDMETASQVADFPLTNGETVFHQAILDFSPDGKYLMAKACPDFDGPFTIPEPNGESPLPQGSSKEPAGIWDFQSHQRIDSDNAVVPWVWLNSTQYLGLSLRTKELCYAQLPATEYAVSPSLRQNRKVAAIAVGPDSRQVAFDFSTRRMEQRRLYSSEEIEIWDVQAGKKQLSLPLGPVSAKRSMAYTADGKILAASTRYNQITLWDAHTGEVLKILEQPEGVIEKLQFSKDGKRLFAATNNSVAVYRLE